MLLLHSPLILALGLSINTVIIPQTLENTTVEQSQGAELPLLIAGRLDRRRRSDDCGTPPHVWTISLCQTDPFCYVDPNQVELWMPNDKRSGGMVDRIVIKNTDNDQQVKLRWRDSEATLSWPLSEMPIQSGTAYLITLKKSRGHSPNQITMYQVPSYYRTDADRAEWMMQRGCIPQADMLDQNS